MYPIINLNIKDRDKLEQLGTKSKFWFKYKGESYLFKEGRINTGENWAEVVVSRICDLLEIPHVHYDFAICDAPTGTRDGVISKNFVPQNFQLIHANEFFHSFTKDAQIKNYKQKEYGLVRVNRVVRNLETFLSVQSPLGTLNGRSTLENFLGYLMLDVLVANQDRHYENWGIIYNTERRFLTPTFDHASSLGRNESDAERCIILSTKDKNRCLQSYAARAKSAIFDSNGKRLNTIDAFIKFKTPGKDATNYWLNKLELITEDSLKNIFTNIPKCFITLHARDFAVELILHNKERLLQIKD